MGSHLQDGHEERMSENVPSIQQKPAKCPIYTILILLRWREGPYNLHYANETVGQTLDVDGADRRGVCIPWASDARDVWAREFGDSQRGIRRRGARRGRSRQV
jgi:hypothetical protein